MSAHLNFALALTLSYLLGSLSGSLIVGRLRGVDIRKLGSGNAGATNALRTQGKIFAAATVLIDAGKGALAALVIAKLSPERPESAFACAFAAVLGHCFPVFFGFRGGKGAGTALGAMLALIPYTALIALSAWLICLIGTGYAGLSTVIAALTGALAVLTITPIPMPALLYAQAIFLLIAGLHHGNIRRLFAGTESRFEKARLLRRFFGRP